jgi:hypothetical protein
MSKTTTRQSRQRDQLVLALLQQPGVEKAGASIGMSSATAWRISKTPEFKRAYHLARREAYSQSMGRLQQATGAAASTLLKIMVNENAPAASRVRAADCILGRAANALELEDVLVRLEELEKLEKDKKGNA